MPHWPACCNLGWYSGRSCSSCTTDHSLASRALCRRGGPCRDRVDQNQRSKARRPGHYRYRSRRRVGGILADWHRWSSRGVPEWSRLADLTRLAPSVRWSVFFPGVIPWVCKLSFKVIYGSSGDVSSRCARAEISSILFCLKCIIWPQKY